MGRKRKKGKARKATQAVVAEEQRQQKQADAEDKLLQEAVDRFTEQQRQQSLARQFQQHLINNGPKCMHGSNKIDAICSRFVFTFNEAFNEAACKVPYADADLLSCLAAAQDATLDEFAEVWCDSAKMKMAISWFLFVGTQNILSGNYEDARDRALMARYFEQHIAVVLEQTQAQTNFPKLNEACHADMHTLVKFLRKRISCTCLDEKYEEVKSITKMGICSNIQCNLPHRMTERSNTMYCSRCRCVAYCSRACQRADWITHKRCCDTNSAIKAEWLDDV